MRLIRLAIESHQESLVHKSPNQIHLESDFPTTKLTANLSFAALCVIVLVRPAPTVRRSPDKQFMEASADMAKPEVEDDYISVHERK